MQKVALMRPNIIMFRRGFLAGQVIVEALKEVKYSTVALGDMNVKPLSFAMTVTRNYSIIRFSCLKISSGFQTSSEAEDLENI